MTPEKEAEFKEMLLKWMQNTQTTIDLIVDGLTEIEERLDALEKTPAAPEVTP